MKKILFLSVVMFCAGALLFSQAGSKRYVAVQGAALKDSTGAFAKELGTLALGTEVTVVAENGKWTQVRAGNLSGWVATASLSARRVTASNAAVTANDVALAGKGFSAEVETEYKKSGLNYAAVDSMETINVPAADLQNFVTEGHLNKGD